MTLLNAFGQRNIEAGHFRMRDWKKTFLSVLKKKREHRAAAAHNIAISHDTKS